MLIIGSLFGSNDNFPPSAFIGPNPAQLPESDRPRTQPLGPVRLVFQRVSSAINQALAVFQLVNRRNAPHGRGLALGREQASPGLIKCRPALVPMHGRKHFGNMQQTMPVCTNHFRACPIE